MYNLLQPVKVGSYRDFFPYLWYWGLLFPWALTFESEGARAYVLHKSCQKWHHLYYFSNRLITFEEVYTTCNFYICPSAKHVFQHIDGTH
jgi:hypothetical protein